MPCMKYILLVLLLFSIFILSLNAKPEVEDIQRAKNATVLIELVGGDKGYGSAFCIDNIGIYVTNAHFVKNKGVGEFVDLILRPGNADQAKIKSKVVRVDEKIDLAILIAQEKANHVKLDLGNSEELIETTPVVGYGYPFGKDLAVNKDSYPSISVNMGRVTALRKSAGLIDMVQLDVTLNPGNSGGPIVDEKGKVVGIVVSGIVGIGGVNFAIPVDKLKKLLVEPIVDVNLPSVKYEDRFKPAKFSVLVTSIVKNLEDKYSVTLTTSSNGLKTTIPLTSLDNKLFEGMSVPVKATNEKFIKVTAVYSSGEVSGITVSKNFTAKATTCTLDMLQEIEDLQKVGDKDMYKLTFKDGKTFEDDLKTLKNVDIDLGNKIIHSAELKYIEKLIFHEKNTDEESISYEVLIKNGDKEIAKPKGTFSFAGAPTKSDTNSKVLETKEIEIVSGNIGIYGNFEPMQSDKVEIKLPGNVENIAVGGGGKYLILQISKMNKFAIFDTSKLKIVDYIPMLSTDVLFTAGATKLIVVYRDKNIIQRYSLETFAKEATKTVPIEGVVKTIVMGCANESSFLMHWAKGTGEIDKATYAFFDIKNFNEIKTDSFNVRNGSYRDLVHMRASADGHVYGMWCTSHSPSGMITLIVNGKNVKSFYEHNSSGFVVPAYDGSFIMSGIGKYTLQLKGVGKQNLGSIIPAYNPIYYLLIPSADGSKVSNSSIYNSNSDTALFKLPELSEMTNTVSEEWSKDDFTTDKRYHLIPQFNLLVTIPYTNDKLVLRKLDIKAELIKNGLDFLYVTSTPPSTIKLGATFSYQIKVESNKGGLKYNLDSGPAGMSISSSGLVTWRPKNENTENNFTVIITISDAGGQELFHTFKLSLAQ